MVQNELTYPLITRSADEPIAMLGSNMPLWVRQCLDEPLVSAAQKSAGQLVRAEHFIAHVRYLARCMPDHTYVINLCENRYLFTLVFCAAILKGQANLLPPNKKPLTQQRMQERYGDVYIAHDVNLDPTLLQQLPLFDLRSLPSFLDTPVFDIPSIPLSQLAAISFTSGSTGDSQPNLKNWRTIVESSRINARHMLQGMDQPLYQLATVPAQHMWGLETSVLLALFDQVCVYDGKPLFPQDIRDALADLPEPRMLVSTPVHLRALAAGGLEFPPVCLLLCATSPLSDELAATCEAHFGGEAYGTQLREVYGCSEVGSMAWRRSAVETEWHLFNGIELTPIEGASFASTAYLPDPIRLQDRIDVSAEGRFTLGGRDSDMVDIAGKRGSLLELNKVLLNYPQLLDGIIFMPEVAAHKGTAQRLAAMVVFREGGSVSDLKNYLSKHFDSAFIPRPIVAVDALPREENGKLPRKQLQSFYERARKN